MPADSVLLKLLNGNPEQRIQGMKMFYSQSGLKEDTIAYLCKRGATKEEAYETYQESYKSFYRVFKDGKFEGLSSLKTFFFSVCYKRWWDIKRRKKEPSFDPSQVTTMTKNLSTPPQVNRRLDAEDRKQYVGQMLTQMGKNCRELILWKYDGYSDDEIKDRLNLDTDRPVRKQRFACMKKLRDTIKKQPELAYRLQQLYRYE